MYVSYVLVQYAAVCHYRRFCVCVPGVPVLVKSGHRVSMTRFHQDRNSRLKHNRR